MALADLQTFIQQCLQQVDSTIDLTSGSPYDVQVVQPILQRVGTDPFTVDIGLFIQTLINQQFPDMTTKEGDAITDLLIKAAVILWNPIVREISRISNAQSFANPTLLTTDEADALGANLFASRDVGSYATLVVRLYFAQAQDINVTPSNFVTAQGGLHFYPTQVQSISSSEMALNVESSLYYFDINTVAEAAGSQYSIGVNQVITIANLPSATRITNKVAATAANTAQTAADFVGSIAQDLTERSMVTQRGIVAQLTAAFPQLTQVNPIGFNDPEMQRDVLTGGGLGPILASGVAMFTEPDGSNAVLTRRVSTAEVGVDFTALIGPLGAAPQGYSLTLVNAFPAGSLPLVRDLAVLTLIDPQTLDLAEESLVVGATGLSWSLRQSTLTLSDIPGGILFPNTPYGTLQVSSNQVHIGGCTDIYVRAQAFDSATLVLSNLSDESPLLQGVELSATTTSTVTLSDLVLGADYGVGDATYLALQSAAAQNLTVQILDPPNAGDYRILLVQQTLGASPVLTVDQPINAVGGAARWKVSSSITVDLVEPKDVKVSGSDLTTVQGQATVSTLSGVDFDDYGVAPGDTLRISSGVLIVGDYTVTQVLSPLFTQLQVDSPLPATVSGAQYTVFTPNPAGGILTPFVRVDSIDLLDAASQPVGTVIPYADPVDVQSSGFANSAHGVKFDLDDGILGIVTQSLPSGAVANTLTLVINWPGASFTVTFLGSNPIPLSTLVSQINTAVLRATGLATTLAILLDNGNRIGLLPVAPNVQVTGGTAMTVLFGGAGLYLTSRDIRSTQVFNQGGWASLRPALDSDFDLAQVLDGTQVGFYSLGLPDGYDTFVPVPNLPFNATFNDPLRMRQDFNPEVGRHIQVGSRSLGTARVYFLDPTSFQVDANAVFTQTAESGAQLNFFPDPTATYQVIPPLPTGAVPTDGSTGGALTAFQFESPSTDFIAYGVQAGDELAVTYVPLTGAAVLPDPVPAANTTTVILSLGGAPDKTIVFIHDSNSIAPTAVTRAGIAGQINTAVGQTICSLTASSQLQFNPSLSVVVRAAGTANSFLGFSTAEDQDNDSPNIGAYTVASVGSGGNPNLLTTTTAFPSSTPLASQQFSVSRVGLQRLASTAMAAQQDPSGLYYFDVTLVSEGTGDIYNLAAQVALTVTGFDSDGYYLTTADSDLTFSPAEQPLLHVSRSILEVGVTDDPANATQLAGQNIQLNYDRSSLTNDVDNFARSDTERVINDSPLGRHLIPYFVRFAMNYAGGSAPSVLLADIQTFILALAPTELLEVSDLEHLASLRNATSVSNPIDLVALIHNVDRSISTERSQNALNAGRLAAFFPDVLNIMQSTS